MTTMNKVRGTAMRMPAGILLGVAVGLSIATVLIAILCCLVLNGGLDQGNMGYYLMCILFVSSFVGSLSSIVKIKRRSLLVGCITGMVFYLLLLLFTTIFFGRSFEGLGVTAILVSLGSVCSTVVGLKKGKNGAVKFKK